MNFRRLSLGLFALVGVLGLVSTSSAATLGAGVWGEAVEVPGTASLNIGGYASLTSVSCAAAGECAAGGQYLDGSGHYQAFVVSETGGVWGTAVEVPGTATLNSGGVASVSSVSCGAAGECAAGGSYRDGSGHYDVFVVSETGGVWGSAVQVPGTATLNRGGVASVSSVSCGAAGECAAGGSYYDGSSNQQAFVVSETGGVWGSAVEVPGTATLNSGYASVTSVSCGAARECAAGGYYYDGSSNQQVFVVSETGGVWGSAVEVPGTGALNSGGIASLTSLSCGAAGECAAGGSYYDDSFDQHAFVVSETGGVWGTAVDVPGMATLDSGGYASVTSVSCGAPGECAAGGSYYDDSSNQQVFVVSETGGVWGTAVEVPGTGALNSGGYASLTSVSCGAAGECAAGGPYYDDSFNQQAFVVSETGGVWGSAVEVPGTATLNSGGYASLTSVSCAAAGQCAAGGFYGDDSENGQAFVVNYPSPNSSYSLSYAGNGSNGGLAPTDGSSPYTPGATVTVLGAGTLTRRGYTFNGWNTQADGGGTSYRPGGTFSMPASDVTLYAQWVINRELGAGTTTCNGTYAGTGSSVVVPAFATCTLIRGAHVKLNVTVKPRGTLLINGVSIGGKLTMSGSATICGSKIGGAIVATGGSLVLGGPACAGNTISGNVLVQNDANNVWVWGNKLKNGSGLTVKHGTGATGSIIRNMVSGSLLVEYSGPPFEVSKNHANTARCVHNQGETGSGNVAKRINTCPH